MKTRWNALSRPGRWMMLLQLGVATFCLIAVFVDAISMNLLRAVILPWAVLTMTWAIYQNRRLNKITKRIRRTSDLTASGAADLSSLPPEEQEEIQMSWARHVLNRRER